MDFRVQKTYQALFQALRDLMVEKPFEKITVTELCQRAQTRTATFYSHFSDKYDLFAAMIEKERESLLARYERENQGSLSDEIEFLIQTMLEQLTERYPFILAIEDNPVLVTIMQSSSNVLKTALLKRLEEHSVGHQHSPELLVEFLNGAISRTLMWWIQSRREIDQERLILEMRNLVESIVEIS